MTPPIFAKPARVRRERRSAAAPADSNAFIAPSNFLAQLSAADLSALEAAGKIQRFDKGALIFRSGGPGENVYFLRAGKVKIHQLSPLGREVILWFCFAGEIFGLAEVARGGGRVVNAQACAGSEVLTVSRDRFTKYVHARPHVAMLSMQVLSSRLRVLGEMVVNLVSDDVDTRIIKLIVRLGARYGVRTGNEIALQIPLTHQEIADMVGTSRQTVTSVLGALKRRGVISIDNRLIQMDSANLARDLAEQTPLP